MIAEVIVDISNSELDKIYDYILPDEIENPLGKRVLVPFGSKRIEGYIVGIKEKSKLDDSKLKEILYPIDDFNVILPEMISLMNFMSEKFRLRKVDCIRLFIPSEMRTGKIKPVTISYVSIDYTNYDKIENIKKNAKNQLAIIEYLKVNKEAVITELSKKYSYSSIKKLINENILKVEYKEHFRNPKTFVAQKQKFEHTVEQKRAIEGIKEDKTYVLYGVTGSGKTEVYMSLIEKVIEKGKNAILLVPEISLTPQILSQFRNRFGESVAILHSGLSTGERFDEWRRLLLGKAKIAIGARSAIFAPLSNLGIVIIDEEHEQTYFSESNPRYYTHDIAIYRARENKCPIVLGSATPSIDTYHHVETGEYELFELPVRTNGRELPKIQIVDMLQEIRNGNSGMFSSYMLEELEKCVRNKKQAMLFINRRGFSSFMRCRECGYVAKCTDCDVSLVYHKTEEKLKCHFCGKAFKALTSCPNCRSVHIRQGAIGTEKVVEELERLFPSVKVLRMDNDTTQNKDAHIKILTEFSKTTPCILVGTQMIAKGHDFKDVTFVGIVDADQSLYQSDYKSVERTFQLITQMSGRAGRSEDEGKIILQTYSPGHYVYRFVANYNYKGFYDKEINLRKTTKFPPYSKIVRLLFSGEKEEQVRELTKQIYYEVCEIQANNVGDIIYLDAMKSPHNKIKNKFRYQILMRIHSDKVDKILPLLYNVCDNIKKSKVTTFVELNPQNLG